MQTRTLGDVKVSAIGLGAMPFSTEEGYDEARAERTLHAALDAGVTLVDTADAYGPTGYGVNESLVAKGLATYAGAREEVIVATKGGHSRDGKSWDVNGRPDYLRKACEASLRRLGVDTIDLYQHHRPDPDVPYAETMGGLKDLYDAGLIRRAGISNADPDQIRLAHEVLGDALVAVQNQFSPKFRSSEPEITVCEELGLAFLPWSPLGGMREAKDLGSTYSVFAAVARAHDATPQQVCLAWELAKSPVMIPIPGASRPESIESSAASVDVVLTAEDLSRLDA